MEQQLFFVTDSDHVTREIVDIDEECINDSSYLEGYLRSSGNDFCNDSNVSRVAMALYQGTVFKKAMVYEHFDIATLRNMVLDIAALRNMVANDMINVVRHD